MIDGGEWINTASDLKLGLYDVAKNYSLQGLHQAIGIQDIMINGKAWRALPPDLQAIVATACTQSILDGMMYFVEENAKALKILIKEKGVKMFDAPAGYSDAFIKSSKKVLAKFEAKDPFFKKVLDSQRSICPSGGSLHQRDQQADAADRRGRGNEISICRTDGRVA